MVAVAAIFIHYLLTPTQRSRRQVMLLVQREPLRIRNCTIAVHFIYVYVLLIQKLRLLIHITYTTYSFIYLYIYYTYYLIRLPQLFFNIRLPRLYTYIFTVSAATIAPIITTTAITLIHRPILFITIILLYLPSYLLSVYVYCTLIVFYLCIRPPG